MSTLSFCIPVDHLQRQKGLFFLSEGLMSSVYLLLKGQRLNIQYPQLSAGNKHLTKEEEGGCDLERNPCVGGMTLASLADPDVHAKGA